MKSQSHWQIARSTLPRPDGAHRWDLAYQFLLRWAMEAEAGKPPAPCPQPQEESHGNCPVCARFDQPPAADPDD